MRERECGSATCGRPSLSLDALHMPATRIGRRDLWNVVTRENANNGRDPYAHVRLEIIYVSAQETSAYLSAADQRIGDIGKRHNRDTRPISPAPKTSRNL